MVDTPDTNSYLYNARSELTSATAAVDSAYRYGYNFDDIGNRRASAERGVNSAYMANWLNQYTAVDDFAPVYDADGNQTRVKTATGVWSVTYNGENRPVRWQQGPTVITMSFDRMGRRVTKNDQRFVYNGYLCIKKIDDSATAHSSLLPDHYFIGDPTEPVATRPLVWHHGSSVAYYTHDGNKNVSEVIDSNNDVATHYEYAPFGALTVSRGASAADNPWRFSSEYAEDDTATVYYNYRHYEPVTGRWMARDPILSSFDKLTERDKLVFDYLFVENAVIIGIDVVGLELKMSGCECEDKIKDAVDLANHWLQQPKCKKWFEDHGYNSDDHTVACHGGGKSPCWFFPAWTMPFGRLGVCVNQLEGASRVRAY